jgi:hypothetical protein
VSTIIHRLCGGTPECPPRSRSLVRLGLTVGLVTIYALSMLLLFAPATLRAIASMM